MSKHKIKGWVRGAYGRFVWHTGLWRLFSRCMPRRLVILAGHCVGSGTGLPADMTISTERLDAITRALSKGFAWRTIGAGTSEIQSGARGPSLAAWSFDDGYRDNFEVLLPCLQANGARATLFLEGRPLCERRVSWSHQYFWLLHVAKVTPVRVVEALQGLADSGLPLDALAQAARSSERAEYLVKRVLKYDCDAQQRDAALLQVFEAHGGDESELCQSLYMTPEMARELNAAGVELGGHTYSHEVLASLHEETAAEEIQRGRAAMQSVLGEPLSSSFAYPYGRRWDFRKSEVAVLPKLGYAYAVTTHPGVVTKSSAPYHLPRVMVEESTPIHHILCEACGAYAFLRRFGIELAE